MIVAHGASIRQACYALQLQRSVYYYQSCKDEKAALRVRIKEIAYSLGYEDDKYFIRLFGKTTGTSPASFRKNKISKSVVN